MGGDARRTLLVVGEDVDLFAAIRPVLDGEMLSVRWVIPAEFSAAVADLALWPWGVAGSGAAAVDFSILGHRPVLWWWLGSPPAGLPAGVRCHGSWRSLADDVRVSLDASFAGLRLAPNRGVSGPDRRLMLSPELEGLLASQPNGVMLSPGVARRVARVLERNAVPAGLVSHDGAFRLEARG